MKQSIQTGKDVTFNVTDHKNQRLPVYKQKTPFSEREDVVYLSNGEEFKIELKNYLKERIAAKIFINNKELSNMIILRPGEHIYLERFLDDNKKFVFQTYKVDGDKQTIASTESNGEVRVEYYKEYQQHNYGTIKYINPSYYSDNIQYFPYGTTDCTYKGDLGEQKFKHSYRSYSKSADISESNMKLFSCSMDSLSAEPQGSLSTFETGRIEKGNKSDQNFDYITFNPCSYAFETFNVRLMSRDNKPVFMEDIRVYCTGCGERRRKDSHVFCPKCGQKYE